DPCRRISLAERWIPAFAGMTGRKTAGDSERSAAMNHAAIRSQELNPASLATLYRKEFQLCRVAAGETIAVVSDLATRREFVAASFAAAAELGADIYELCVNSVLSWTKVGVSIIGRCKGTLEAVRAADLVVVFHVPLFTKWLKEVLGGGTRV